MKRTLFVLVFVLSSMITINANEFNYSPLIIIHDGWNIPGTHSETDSPKSSGINIFVSNESILIYSYINISNVQIQITDTSNFFVYNVNTTLFKDDCFYIPINNFAMGVYKIIISQKNKQLYGMFNK